MDRLGDRLDPPEPGVPRRPDRRELGDSARQLRLVDAVPLLATLGRGPDQADPVQDDEVLGHGLARHGQLLAQRGGGAVPLEQQQVEHPAPHGISDRGPEVVVDRVLHSGAHGCSSSVATYGASRGRKWSQPYSCSRYCCSRTAASQPISRKPVSVILSSVPSPDGVRSKVTSSELPAAAISSAGCVQRNENVCGGRTSTTVKGTTPPPA